MEWIKVKDRLPEEDVKNNDSWQKGKSIECLVRYSGNTWFGRYWYSAEFWILDGICGSKVKPTHWMPLPEPPKE